MCKQQQKDRQKKKTFNHKNTAGSFFDVSKNTGCKSQKQMEKLVAP